MSRLVKIKKYSSDDTINIIKNLLPEIEDDFNRLMKNLSTLHDHLNDDNILPYSFTADALDAFTQTDKAYKVLHDLQKYIFKP